MNEDMEALFKGQKGEKGDRGEKGARGLPRGQARAVVYLFAVAAIPGWLGLFWQVHESDANQAAARRAGQVIEQKLCATFGELAANKPPAGNPLTNPSRGYDQRNHAILSQIGPDLDCTKIRKA